MSITNLEIGYPMGMPHNPAVYEGMTRILKLATCYRLCKPSDYGFNDNDLMVSPKLQQLAAEFIRVLTQVPLDTPCRIQTVNYLSDRILVIMETIGDSHASINSPRQ